MRILALAENEHGYHETRAAAEFPEIPVGWAMIPQGMPYPASFPFVTVTAQGQTVTGMTAKETPVPAPASPPPEPDDPTADLLEAVLDHQVRLTLLELGVEPTANT